MGLIVFYQEDIANSLLAAEQSTNAATQATGDKDDPFTAGYLVGHRAALTTIALAFGLASRDDQAGLPRLTNTQRPLALAGGNSPSRRSWTPEVEQP